MTLTEALANIESRLKDATRGPWSVEQLGSGMVGPNGEFEQWICFDSMSSLASVRRGADDPEYGDDDTVRANADLIANAPTDLAKLLEAVRLLWHAYENICDDYETVRTQVLEILGRM